MLSLRPNSFHRDDQPDFNVVWRGPAGARAIGRIFRAQAGVPADTPWIWSVEFHQRQSRKEPHQGWSATREEAMTSFKVCWLSSPRQPTWHARPVNDAEPETKTL
jgi:hypothetical protein